MNKRNERISLNVPRPLWVARIVTGPISEQNGRWFHGGQMSARACGTRLDAIYACRELAGGFATEVSRGARFIIEPGFMSCDSTQGRKEAPLTAEQVNQELIGALASG